VPFSFKGLAVCLALLPLLAVVVTLVAVSEPQYNEFLVTQDGTLEGDGSWARPWDLATALSHPAAVKPGDTVWLREGTYVGRFECRLKGEPTRPITVRAMPNERVTVDFGAPTSEGEGLAVRGSHTHFRDLEFVCSDTTSRTTASPGSHPEDIRRGQITDYGSYNKFINLVVHDLNKGLGLWSSGTGGEVYGCIIYNNGWRGADRNHGPGIYVQNESGNKTIAENVIFHQFGRGIQAYASTAGHVRGINLSGNVVFNSGAAAGASYERSADMLIGGGDAPRDIAVQSNFTFQSSLDGFVYVGWASPGEDIALIDNYFVGSVRLPTPWSSIRFLRNTIVAHDNSAVVFGHPQPIERAQWDRNRYQSMKEKPFQYGGADRTWLSWQEESRWDGRSDFQSGPADGVSVFVRPNRYEQGRAHIVVYNWDMRQFVDVDLAEVLARGDGFEIHHVFDLFGDPVAEGTFDGRPMRLTLSPRQAPRPVAYDEDPITLSSEFAVFLLRKKVGE
jgi:hypothetical protein